MPIYNKLVRDGIPKIIECTNKKYTKKVLNPSEHEVEIKNKLLEELKEYQEATSNEEAIEELANLLELIYTVLPLHGSTMKELEDIRVKKYEQRGGLKRVLLNRGRR